MGFVLGPYFLAIIAVVAVVGWMVCLVDIVRHSDAEWTASGKSKGLWLALVFLLSGAVIPELVYWFSVRPKLRQARATMPSSDGTSLPPPGWYRDAQGHGLRWWDGGAWTSDTQPVDQRM